MIRRLTNSGVVWLSVGLACLYCVATAAIRPDLLIQILNGIFIGTFVSVTAAYWRLLSQAFFGYGEYDRVRQYALGVGVLWIAFIIGRLTSIYFRSVGDTQNFSSNVFVGVQTYLAIIAGVLQVTAQGLDEGYLVGRDKWFLYGCFLAGAAVAIVLIVLQSWGTGTLVSP